MNISTASAVSGSKAAQQRLDFSAHDISNVNTPGYQQTTPYQTEMAPSGTQISHAMRTPNYSATLSNTDLAEEVVEQKNSVASLKANTAVIKAQDRMVGTLLDIFG